MSAPIDCLALVDDASRVNVVAHVNVNFNVNLLTYPNIIVNAHLDPDDCQAVRYEADSRDGKAILHKLAKARGSHRLDSHSSLNIRIHNNREASVASGSEPFPLPVVALAAILVVVLSTAVTVTESAIDSTASSVSPKYGHDPLSIDYYDEHITSPNLHHSHTHSHEHNHQQQQLRIHAESSSSSNDSLGGFVDTVDVEQYPGQFSPNDNDFMDRQSFTTPTIVGSGRHRKPPKEYLTHELAERACRRDRGCQRKDTLNNTYLSYCARHKLESLLSNEILMSIMHDSSEECEQILDEFIQLDELIDQFDVMFKNLLSRYNCRNGYSVVWTCDDCKRAYKDWLCTTNLPFYMNGERIKPCISFCERVEQKCPYWHPITREQYGGQPVFICRDRDIPVVPSITPDILYSEPGMCYDLCHITDDELELKKDSLSKYDKCPKAYKIAEEVRSDPLYCKLDTSNTQLTHNPSEPATDQPDKANDSVQAFNTIRPEVEPMLHNGKPHGGAKRVPVHRAKLAELSEVLATYANQPRVQSFGHH